MRHVVFPHWGPGHTHRIVAGLLGLVGFLGAAGLGDTLVGQADGSHQGFIACTLQCSPVHTAVFLVAAFLSYWAVAHPHKPDVQVTRNLVVALALIAVVVGAVYFVDATTHPANAPGPGTWSLLLAAIALIYAGFRKDLWPESRFLETLQEAATKRASRRR